MKRFLPVAFILFSISHSFAQSAEDAAVRKVLSNQEVAWNSGSIDDFMKGYWASDSLVFIGKSVTYGWQPTLENYKKRYPDTAAMGKLLSTCWNVSHYPPVIILFLADGIYKGLWEIWTAILPYYLRR
jgi:hypothetical protein